MRITFPNIGNLVDPSHSSIVSHYIQVRNVASHVSPGKGAEEIGGCINPPTQEKRVSTTSIKRPGIVGRIYPVREKMSRTER